MAHTQLLEAHGRLGGLGVEPPHELGRCLALLHSYVLVKSLARGGGGVGFWGGFGGGCTMDAAERAPPKAPKSTPLPCRPLLPPI